MATLPNRSSNGPYMRDPMSRATQSTLMERSYRHQQANKEHNSNFRAGHVAVYEDYLYKTGLRGHKACLFYIILFLLFLVVLGNLGLTTLLLYVLKISSHGVPNVEFLPDGDMRFEGHNQIDSVVSDTGVVGSFKANGINIVSDDVSVVADRGGMEMKEGSVKFRCQNLNVIDPLTGRVHFNLSSINQLPKGVKTIKTTRLTTPNLRSSVDVEEDLSIVGGNGIRILGSEGVSLESSSIVFKSDKDIRLVSLDGKVIFGSGVILNTTATRSTRLSNVQVAPPTKFKLCLCKDNKKVFRVRIQDNVNSCRIPLNIANPCL